MTYWEMYPDQEAERRGLLFLTSDAEHRWKEIIALRNSQFKGYIVKPECVGAQMIQARQFKGGSTRRTFSYLTENWERIIKGFLDACLEAGTLKIVVHKKED